MKEIEKFTTLEEGILLLKQEAKYMPITIGEILRILSKKALALVVIFLVLPFCQPIQIPGLSVPFGLAIAFIGLRMAFGRHVLLSERVLSKVITPQTLEKITDTALLVVNKMKRWVHPRLNWVCHASFMQILNGLTVFSLGICLALPLPVPFSNLTAGWSIFLIALGVLEDDGVLVLIGYVASLLTLVFFVAIVFWIVHFL